MELDPRWKTGHRIGPALEEEIAYDSLHVGALPTGRIHIDLRDRCPPVRQQKRQNCVEHAVAAQIVINARREGIELPEPSVDFMYAAAQIYERPMADLRDEGTVVRTLFQALSERGDVQESEWPERDGPLEMPPDDLWRDAEEGVILEYSTIPDGARTDEALYAALFEGFTSTVCWIVDEAYANIGDRVYSTLGGKAIGSHCQLCVGFDPSAGDRGAFIVRGSWGEEFGDLGYALVDPMFLNLYSYDKMIVRRGPRRIV